MNQKVTKKLQAVVSLALAAVFVAAVPCTEASAAELNKEETVEVMEAAVWAPAERGEAPKLRTGLTNCIISVGFLPEGLLIAISTETSKTAKVIGVKDIKVQKKVWYGWSTVAVSDGGEQKNVSAMGCQMMYTGAEKGETYRILCTHYGDVDGYAEHESNSGEFIYTY